MAGMTDKHPCLLIDTNVWITYFLGNRPGHEDARALLRTAIERGVDIAYPVASSKDLFFVIAKDIKVGYRSEHRGELTDSAAAAAEATAWACVEHLSELAIAVPCDHTDIWMATRQRKIHGDFEDDLVIAAAIRSHADLLVTLDERLRAHATVACADVKTALLWLENLPSEEPA